MVKEVIFIKKARSLQKLRERYHRLNNRMTEKYAIYRKETEKLGDQMEKANEKMIKSEESLRQLALKEYDRTENRNPGPGVEVRILTKIGIPEPDDEDPGSRERYEEMWDWCIKHRMFLIPHSSEIRRFVRAMGSSIPGVYISEELTVVLARDFHKQIRKESDD